MVLRVEVPTDLIVWARERSGRDPETLANRFPVEQWEAGTRSPTLKQPPAEPLPIPDFRTIRDDGVHRASPDLLDTIYDCQQRKEWFKAFAVANGLGRVGFIGSSTLSADTDEVAGAMSEVLDYDPERRIRHRRRMD